MIIDSTVKGRIIMMMFLDSIDLFEQLISLQQDYTDVHNAFDDSDIITVIEETLGSLKNELSAIGYAIQFNHESNSLVDIDALTKKLLSVFSQVRKNRLNKNSLALFIKLRQIIYALQDVSERIKRLHHFSTYDKMSTRQYKRNAKEERIKTNEISPALLFENITFKSSQFKHALRVTTGLLIGYSVSLFFPLGHGYWILLTIATILKPAYSISRTRNKQRLLGTVTGVIIGFVFLYFVKSNTLAFLLLLCTMVIAYSLLKLNYYISCVCITVYVLISFHFLNNSNFDIIIKDRLIDTIIGCGIAFIISFIVFPVWEHEQIKDLIINLVTANKKYFNEVALLPKLPANQQEMYKPARKESFIALANLNDSFQRILSEKRNKADTSFYHQFVSNSYMLTAHIASLSALIKRSDFKINDKDLDPLINNINDKFKRAESILKGENIKAPISNRNAPITNKVQALLQKRQAEIESGIRDVQTETRNSLRVLKSVTDEFEIINSIANDEVKILQKI